MSEEFNFEVKEIQRTTFRGKSDSIKVPIVVAHLEDEESELKVKVREECESSFVVGEIWTLSKTDKGE